MLPKEVDPGLTIVPDTIEVVTETSDEQAV
jgi:hypothetical protein